MTLEQVSEYKLGEKALSIVVFCQDKDAKECTHLFNDIESASNINVVVQPCPYEGIEFLFRTPMELPQSFLGEETDFFWHGLWTLKKDQLNTLSQAHYAFFLAILQQDAPQLSQIKRTIEQCMQ